MYQKILLAYDGTRESRAMLREGAELARLCGAQVHLLAVARPAPGLLFAEGAEPGGLLEAETRHLQQVLEEGVDKLRQRGLHTEASLRHGDPSREILALAETIDADLIVLGHHRRNALARWWHGAVDADILADAPCSLLIAIAPEVDDGEGNDANP